MDDLTSQSDNEALRQEDSDKDSASSNSQVDTLLAIESAINRHLSMLEKIKEETKPVREMITTYLENDERYMEAAEKAKNASKEKSVIKKELLAKPEAKELKAKLDSLKEKAKDAKEGLSYYLSQFQKHTGANEIETSDGELREIKYTARLVRKTSLNR